MRKYVLLGSICLGSIPTVSFAQGAFSAGPRLGFTVGTVDYSRKLFPYDPTASVGWQAGGMANLQLGPGHLALQGSLLFDRRAFGLKLSERVGGTEYKEKQVYRLNYISLPLNLAYTQRRNGQGLQLFAGGYLAALLGGGLTSIGSSTRAGITTNEGFEANVRPGKEAKEGRDIYFQPLDAGLQAGVGYRYRAALLQLTYSHGLTDFGTVFVFPLTIPAPRYYNRALQVTLTYLFGHSPDTPATPR